jgi:hypothetical protein
MNDWPLIVGLAILLLLASAGCTQMAVSKPAMEAVAGPTTRPIVPYRMPLLPPATFWQFPHGYPSDWWMWDNDFCW